MASTSFGFDEEMYEQIEGAPMGSTLSPVIEDLYMDFFDTIVITNPTYGTDV